MKPGVIRILSIALLVQVLLVALFWLSNNTSNNGTANQLLLNADIVAADKVVIVDKAQELVLSKVDNIWQLPDYSGLVANESKVNAFLDKLKTLEVNWPVATTDSAAERFEVAEDNAQKKLMFYEGDKSLGTLFLGTAPGFRKTHVRLDTQSEIYAVELAQHDVNTNFDDWFDKGLLTFSGDIAGINKVSIDDVELLQQSGAWTVAPLQEGYQPSTENIQNWLKRFGTLQVNKQVDESVATELLLKHKPQRTVVLYTHGMNTEYRFYNADKQYYVQSSIHPRLFEIAAHQVEPLLKADASEFQQALEVVKSADTATNDS